MRASIIALALSCCLATPSSFGQQSFEQWRAERAARFESFSENYHARFAAYQQRVEQFWGHATALSNERRIVRYTDDLQQRVIIDYEAMTMTVERLDGIEPTDDDIRNALLQLNSLTVDAAAQQDPVLQARQVNDQRSLLTSFTGRTFSNISVQDSVRELLRNGQRTTASQQIQASDGVNQLRGVSIQFDNSDVFRQRAAHYQAPVSIMAQRFDLDPALILAIMQVESSFNPLAQSHIPAFGLMQIVPTSAGVDVNRKLYQLDKAPSSDELLRVDDNIKFGSSFLDILSNDYLAAIEDPQSRLLCVIAAYNTGAGNVASVFHPTGARRVAPAAKVINSLTPEQVYQRLLSDLPFEETRRYLPKVLDAIPVHRGSV